MGFPFEEPTWEGVSGAIFMGFGTAAPGIFTLIAIVLCLLALFFGNMKESQKYKGQK